MKFVSRAQWGAAPPTGSYSHINSTVTTGHWEGPRMGSFPHESCATKLRGIQSYHMNGNGWMDIAYNGVVCPHGYVFEGRGPGVRSAANGTNAANDTSCAVCYLGGEGDPFTPEGQQGMLDAAEWLGDPMDKGHRDWYQTACPGDEIYSWIQSDQSSPVPAPVEDDDMRLYLCVGDGTEGKWWITDLMVKRYCHSLQHAKDTDWWLTQPSLGAGKPLVCNREGNEVAGPILIRQEYIDAVPEVPNGR